MGNAGARNTIVVGVDGSTGSREALTWAAKEAKLRGATLHAVQAWEMPTFAWGILGADWSPRKLIDEAKHELSRVVAATIGEAPGFDVLVTVSEGNPAKLLIEAADADDAELLVVGSRGHGGFKSLLLGSVSEQCVTHVTCPVVVIRPITRVK